LALSKYCYPLLRKGSQCRLPICRQPCRHRPLTSSTSLTTAALPAAAALKVAQHQGLAPESQAGRPMTTAVPMSGAGPAPARHCHRHHNRAMRRQPLQPQLQPLVPDIPSLVHLKAEAVANDTIIHRSSVLYLEVHDYASFHLLDSSIKKFIAIVW